MSKSSKPTECHDCESRPDGIFCDLEQSATRDLEQRKTNNIYKKGQIVFYEGNQALGLYCVSSGRVKLYKTSIDGKQQIVRIASSGDVLGHRALLANEPYHATAEAIEDAEVCCLDRNAFFSLLKKEPSLSMNLLQKLAQELGVAENLAATIAQKSVRERMAELLLTLKETYGEKDGNHYKIGLQLTREEMGNMIGVTQETSIRLMSEFRQEKLIEVSGRDIKILDVERLLQVANLDT